MQIHTVIHIVRQISIVIDAIARNKIRIVSSLNPEAESNELKVPLIDPL
jgi:hypothetical protein